jgi:hypothetical protein
MTTTLVRPDSVNVGVVGPSDACEARSSTEIDLRLEHQSGRDHKIINADTMELLPSHDVTESATNRALSDEPNCLVSTDGGSAMTEDDTVSILDVLDEMQRIIDRHLEKTSKQQDDR